ncbi:MAG: ABC transporter permease [Sedimentibacter sp.]|uniref:ABC transporter permease n=1 Tax=Sedimentibacter sp. TaxID=1960295 RepID=UPI00315947A2
MKSITKFQLFVLDNLVWLLVVLFFIYNTIATPSFFTAKNQINILFQTSLMGVLVLAQGIVMMVGELDLSIDATLAFAPGIAILLSTHIAGLNPMLSILITLVFGSIIGLFNGVCVAKLKANSFLLTLSSQIVMRGLVLFLIPFSLSNLSSIYTYLGRGKIGAFPIAAISLIIIYLIFEVIFSKTIFGRKFILTGGNRQASYISGIKTDRVIIMAFVIAGILSALAGLIAAGRQNAVSNSMGINMGMMAITGAILGGCSFNGGMGKPIGMLGGALLLGMIDNALTLKGVNVNLVSMTKGILIFVAILLDRSKYKIKSNIMYKENLRKLAENADKLVCNSDKV